MELPKSTEPVMIEVDRSFVFKIEPAVVEDQLTIRSILLNHIASKKPAPPTCWNPKAKCPDGEDQEELLLTAVRDEPRYMFL
ncbi:hypothetical protein NC653_000297 [Populus alba x Populus x berolinensis]|uniref:Uncharacterized protein n=1 Tax=Populus alba x Populus x berolinensis TaxID=444605 RepID=A0AAD6WEN9_9ROSI|nr:hypothetical protein NC653_000297 [Populus alba x Populus x berolinensis]